MLWLLLLACADDAACWLREAVPLAQAGRYEEAEPLFAKACQAEPRHPGACYFHARALYALDRFPASLAVLRPLPDSGRVLEARGQAQMALGLSAEAERNLRAAARLDAARHGLALGKFLLREGRAPEAVGPLRQASASAESRFELGRAYLQMNRPAEATAALEEALRHHPDHGPARLLLRKARARTAAPRAHPDAP